MKVVLDINVLVSGLLWVGPSNKILKLVETQNVKLCITPSILTELQQVLYRPKFLSRIKTCDASIEELISSVSEYTLLFPDSDISGIVKDDPEDNKIIACAKISGAEYIVSGDEHLLKLKQYETIPIVTPRKFLLLQNLA